MKISKVSFSQGTTVNLGHFEFLRLDVSAEMTLDGDDDPDEAMKALDGFVTKHLEEQMISSGQTVKPKTAVKKKKKVVRKKK